MNFTLSTFLPGRRTAGPPPEPAPFAGLSVRLVTIGGADERLAVHLAGRLTPGRTPVLCIPGYNRNMSDFATLLPLLRRELATDWPIVLVDLRGRGRSPRRTRPEDYSTTADARDLSALVRALGIETVIVLGQGHGGQVAMALALERPTLIAGAILVDAGPVTAPESLIRLRGNMQSIAGFRGTAGLTAMLRRMLKADYPEVEDAQLDRLSARTHAITAAGRANPLFDPALIRRLVGFTHDDVLTPQWSFFDRLRNVPIMFIRSELTDQLPIPVLNEMVARRPDADGLAIDRQGSPPLLDRGSEVRAIAEFICRVAPQAERPARRS